MHVQFFSVPALDPAAATAEINAFLTGRRIVHVDREFVANGTDSFWAVCVTWLERAGTRPESPVERRGKVDYREILTGEQFAIYARLRNLRRDLAQRDGIPPYALFNNEQLAAMVQQRADSAAAIAAIAGVGEARVAKYGAPFVAVLREALAGTVRSEGQSDPASSSRN